MSIELLNVANFEEIGDVFVIELSPITNVLEFLGFEEEVQGLTGTRTFSREYSFSKNNLPGTGWGALTDLNLQSITSTPTDSFVFKFRYTRTGVDDTDVLILDMFRLNAKIIPSCITLRINKYVWDAIHGTYKYIQINEQVEKFNAWVRQNMSYDNVVCVVDDNTISDSQIIVQKGSCPNIDVNSILKILWGNYLVDYQFKIGVDLYDGVQE